MLSSFLSFTKREGLITEDQKILLSVSGGIDSMVMTSLFLEAGIDVAVAHINFTLRGRNSDLDEKLVRQFSEEHGLPFFCKRFETASYASSKGISVQMAARELRIDYFGEMVRKHGFGCYATAHHLDDQIETFFINLLRGTGLAGLHGILPRQGLCIHPMLFAWRSDIEKYAAEKQIPFREDHTNAETKYIRNKIRHILIPALESINNESKEILTRNIMHIRNAEQVYLKEIEDKKPLLMSHEKGRIRIGLKGLLLLEYPAIYLFEMIRAYGFDHLQAEEILKVKDTSSGRGFFSKTHWMLLDREEILLTEIRKNKEEKEQYIISDDAHIMYEPFRLKTERITKDENYALSRDPRTADLDMKSLSFPLMIRKWKKGDMFYPLGMKHRKKISDFFTDDKISLIDKQNTWLILSGNDIVWVAGYRIDDRFRVTESTEEVLRLSLQD
ncbi:MAG: tRNA lysidine(34) synthetase TilS [Bacteroidales bacterium]|nr:tRNA lysidine(34) synthetase TilS [Bacteroidales bacterium]